uniref:hypothetical protein n=1 Tax=Pontibacterium sp. TaxID=2036026 RepID=UPI00356A5A15
QVLKKGEAGISIAKAPPQTQPQATATYTADELFGMQSDDVAEREAMPAPQDAEQPWYQGAVDLVTGGDKNPEELPEFDLPFELKARQAKTALGLLTTFDPKEQMKIVASNYPDLAFEEDEHGNIVVDGSAYGGERGMLNAPGISLRDLTQLGFQAAAFNPAGRAASLATTTAVRAGAGVVGAGVTQVGIDAASQYSGREENVSLGNTDWREVGTASLFGGGAEIASSVLGRMVPAFRKQFIETGEVTDDMRQAFLKAAEKKGLSADAVNDELIRDYMNLSKNGMPTDQMGDMRKAMRADELTDEFDIPYTRGQATGSPRQLSTEDNLRYGSMGEKGQQVIRNFDEHQDQAIAAAKNKVQAGLSSADAPQIEKVNDAGQIVGDALRSKAAALDSAVGEAYDAVGDAYLNSDGLKGLMKATKNSVRGIEFDPKLKGTADILQGVRSMEKLINAFDGQLKPMHLKRIEAMRRRFNTSIGAAENPSDKRQLMQMKTAFDNYLDTAVDNALFAGDNGALDALKNARSLRTTYALKFQRSDKKTRSGRSIKDDAGHIIERIIEANPTASETANYFFGATKLSKGGGARLANRVKSVLGAESSEWNALREAAFLKLTATETGTKPVSAKMFASRLDDALKGNGAELMKELFTGKERLQFARLSMAVKKADKSPQNGSKTSYQLANTVSQFLPRWFSNFAQRAEMAAGMAGEPVAFVASRAAGAGAKAIEGRGGVKAAKAATSERFLRPFNKVKGNGLAEGAVMGSAMDAAHSGGSKPDNSDQRNSPRQ